MSTWRRLRRRGQTPWARFFSSDERGRYLVWGLEDGTHILIVEAEEYRTHVRTGLEVRVTGTTTEDVTLRRGDTIRGRVLDADGRGVASEVRAVEPAVYAPAMMLDDLMGLDVLRRRGVQLTLGKARLAPGVTIAEASSAVDAVTTTLEATRPEGWQLGSAFALLPTADVLLYPLADPFVRSASWLLMAAAALVLLLACTNLASFLLARGRDRRPGGLARLQKHALGPGLVAFLRLDRED